MTFNFARAAEPEKRAPAMFEAWERAANDPFEASEKMRRRYRKKNIAVLFGIGAEGRFTDFYTRIEQVFTLL